MADLPHVGPVATNKDGVLAEFIQQPVQNTPAIQQGGVIYTEKWKGPYGKGKDIVAALGENTTLLAFWTWLGTNRVSRFTAPACPSTTVNGIEYAGVWRANQITVSQLTAGDHCEITATFQASYDIGSGDIAQPKQNSDLESWTVEWLSYSVSPMAFLANERHEPHEIDVDQALGRTGITGLESELGNASFVIQWQQHNGSSVYYDGSGSTKDGTLNYWWREDPTRLPGQTQMYCLNTAEAAVMDKNRLQRSAVYHYPVVTHTTVFEGYDNSKYTADVGKQLDIVQSLPAECPYAFQNDQGQEKYKWIKIDDSIAAENEYIYKTNASTSSDKKVVATAGRRVKRKWTRKEKWAGYTEVDENFYGTQPFAHTADGIKTTRWQIGKL